MKTQSLRPLDKEKILKLCKDEKIRFLRLQFTDILGINKNVEVPESQFDKALSGEVMFDGSSIQGFVRIEESDMLLVPDLESFRIFPWADERGRVARVICDVAQPDGTPFPGCPRSALKRVVAAAAKMGYTPMLGPEAEFFLFQQNPDGTPTTITHDQGAYFDLAPIDKGEDCRREIVNALEGMGFEIEAAHHEVAPGQHEIDFRYDEAVATADHLVTFKFVVRKIARDFGLHATFMPKPIAGINGSGMHVHQSLYTKDKNVFYDAKAKWQLSATALNYIGGVLAHAKGICAITNPTVNSYKRLVPGYEAPTNIVWSERNRSPMARVPDRRGNGTRVEIRTPDPACNPYLAFAVMIAAGLDGIRNKTSPGEPVNKNIFEMSQREKRRHKIDELPGDLSEALKELKKDDVVKEALGEHLYTQFLEAKSAEWHAYIGAVHQWELDQYLARY
jgi:glutamine synthetase